MLKKIILCISTYFNWPVTQELWRHIAHNGFRIIFSHFYWYKDPEDSQVTCNFYFQGKKSKKVVNKSPANIQTRKCNWSSGNQKPGMGSHVKVLAYRNRSPKCVLPLCKPERTRVSSWGNSDSCSQGLESTSGWHPEQHCLLILQMIKVATCSSNLTCRHKQICTNGNPILFPLFNWDSFVLVLNILGHFYLYSHYVLKAMLCRDRHANLCCRIISVHEYCTWALHDYCTWALHKSLGEAWRIKNSQKQCWYLPLVSKELKQKAKRTDHPKRD